MSRPRCSRSRSRRTIVVGAVVAVLGAGCSGGAEPADADGSVAPSAPVTEPADTGPLFDPTNPEGTEPPVPGTAVVLDDDVIIDTADGEIPTTTTEPPVEPEGPDAPPDPEVTTTTAPVVALPEPADVGRIVSMSPTHTETLFALGLGEFVVAVDASSDFPAEAAAVRRADLDGDSADLSSLLALDPDVVVIGEDPTRLVDRLNAAGVASYSGPPATSLDDVYRQIGDVAAIVGRPDLAEDLIASMRAEIDEIVGALSPGERTYFHEIDPSLVTEAPGGFLDDVYGVLGLTSIVPPGVTADAAGVARLTSDDVVAADPDVIVLADAQCCGVTIDRLASRPGWSGISAVVDGAVVALPDALWMRWGPRVVELVRTVAGGVAAAG